MGQMTPVRITFTTPPDEHGWPPARFERVWALQTSDSWARLDNVPFFTKEATLDDLVEFRVDPDGVCAFVRNVEASENSLIRVLTHTRDTFDRVQKALMDLGCVVEGHATMLMLAVSISRSAGLQAPMDFLVELEEEGELEYEEAIIRL